MGSERIDPLFFGPEDRRLFGCHHGPADGAAARLGLLIAPPLGHEYSRSHRALRQLAAACAAEGVRALRFDFGATGDSAGDAWPTSLDPWRADFELALRELALRTRVPRTAVLGVRFSANLALERAARSPGPAALVLWDPCLDGAAYVQSLETLQERFESELPSHGSRARVAGADVECLGQRWPAALIESLRAWRPPRLLPGGTERVLLLEATLSERARELARDFEAQGARVRHELSSGAEPWQADVDKGLVPAQDLRRIVDFLREER